MLNIMPSQYYDGWGKTGSVIIDAVLIAFFLGFKEIYLLGNDLSYEDNEKTHFYGGGSGERRFSSEIKSAIFLSDSLDLIIKNLNNFFDLNSIKMINLSKGYKHKGLFKTGDLESLF